ncbi:putative E3 ubiquitin-protein ligase SINA-like 6 [Salvia hispanica]|uniref:putative E3 ubiquitin-protein ligase SINA-like 6 n=1 Tax=Salvia hispanica TaxID=49212 RepID=UPI002009914E|nr:putative E3 ubiquitin-protein ligase SINA-like 6 [Salvia hispanica]
MQQVAYIREGEYEQKWAAKGRVRGVRKAKCERKAFTFGYSSTEESGEEGENVQQQPTPRNGDVSQPSGSDTSSGSISVTLTDPDVLDCPICYVPLCSPVYQCENGHIACASCCTTMKNKCASCCWPIGYNRCRAIEKVLESVRVACRNLPRGCLQKFSYSKKLAHEKICNFAAISCPHTGCDFASFSKSVYAHFALKHSQISKLFCFNEVISLSLDKDQKHVFLQEKNMNTVFILNRTVETVGSFVNVVCIAPAAAKKAYLFDLTATVGESSIKLKSVVDVMPKWMAETPAESPTKLYLIVPKAFISISGVMKLELKIFRDVHHNYIL